MFPGAGCGLGGSAGCRGRGEPCLHLSSPRVLVGLRPCPLQPGKHSPVAALTHLLRPPCLPPGRLPRVHRTGSSWATQPRSRPGLKAPQRSLTDTAPSACPPGSEDGDCPVPSATARAHAPACGSAPTPVPSPQLLPSGPGRAPTPCSPGGARGSSAGPPPRRAPTSEQRRRVSVGRDGPVTAAGVGRAGAAGLRAPGAARRWQLPGLGRCGWEVRAAAGFAAFHTGLPAHGQSGGSAAETRPRHA